MRTLTHHIYYDIYGQRFTLYHLTDLHIGAKACDERQLRADIQAIAADPNARWIGGGDYIDGICQAGDRRYKPAALARWVLGHNDVMGIQAEYCVNLLRPIARQCLGLVEGNHEWAAKTFYARDIYWQVVLGISQAADVRPEVLALGAQGFVVINYRYGNKQHRKRSYRLTVYTHHGFGGGRLPGGHALALGRVLGDYDCDLALLGHRHTQIYVPKVVTTPYGFKTRIGMFTASYLDAYIKPSTDGRPVDGYAEQIGLPPQVIGTVPINIQPDTQRIGVVLSNQPGIGWETNEMTQKEAA